METVAETLKNDAASDVENFVQVTQRSLTTAERAASAEHKQCRQTEHLACVDKQMCDNRMFEMYETWFNRQMLLESKHKPC